MPAPTPISAMAESQSPRCPMASLSRSAAALVPCDSSSVIAAARESALPLVITSDAGSGAALHHAIGLDRDLGIGRRQVAPQNTVLLVARLLAGDLDIVRTDLLAEARILIGAKCVGARHHAAAVLHGYGHFRIRNGGAGAILHEAERGGPFILARIVVVAEARAAGPQRGRHDTQGNDQARDTAPATIEETHPNLPPSHFWLRLTALAHGELISISNLSGAA